MYIYAQQGYGKQNRIQRGLDAESIVGAVLSPYDEKMETLERFVNTIRCDYGDKTQILLDPQFYLFTQSADAVGRWLPKYPYFREKLTRTSFRPKATEDYVASVIDYQVKLGLSRILTPTVYFHSFDDAWATIAFQLAQASVDYCERMKLDVPVLASFVFDMSALNSPTAVKDFLNEATLLEVKGFYIVVGRPDLVRRDQFDEGPLANYMRLVNVLAEHGEFEVVCGYSDVVGLLLHAVGAYGTGVGWSNTSRRFSLSKWDKDAKPGGGPPGPVPARYTSGRLLATLSIANDMSTIVKAGRLEEIQSNTALDRMLSSGGRQLSMWPKDIASLHHWEVLAQQAREVSLQGSTAENLRAAENILRDANKLYDTLHSDPSVALDIGAWRPNLNTWLRAIDDFRKGAGI